MSEEINDIKSSLARIEDALIGNDMGNTGIVKRLENVEKCTKNNKKDLSSLKTKSIIFGAGAGGSAIGIVEYIKTLFH